MIGLGRSIAVVQFINSTILNQLMESSSSQDSQQADQRYFRKGEEAEVRGPSYIFGDPASQHSQNVSANSSHVSADPEDEYWNSLDAQRSQQPVRLYSSNPGLIDRQARPWLEELSHKERMVSEEESIRRYPEKMSQVVERFDDKKRIVQGGIPVFVGPPVMIGGSSQPPLKKQDLNLAFCQEPGPEEPPQDRESILPQDLGHPQSQLRQQQPLHLQINEQPSQPPPNFKKLKEDQQMTNSNNVSREQLSTFKDQLVININQRLQSTLRHQGAQQSNSLQQFSRHMYKTVDEIKRSVISDRSQLNYMRDLLIKSREQQDQNGKKMEELEVKLDQAIEGNETVNRSIDGLREEVRQKLQPLQGKINAFDDKLNKILDLLGKRYQQ